jgi:hypothetical protein
LKPNLPNQEWISEWYHESAEQPAIEQPQFSHGDVPITKIFRATRTASADECTENENSSPAQTSSNDSEQER